MGHFLLLKYCVPGFEGDFKTVNYFTFLQRPALVKVRRLCPERWSKRNPPAPKEKLLPIKR